MKWFEGSRPLLTVMKERNNMGEMADYMINGDDCECCGMPLEGQGDGYPRKCTDCGGNTKQACE